VARPGIVHRLDIDTSGCLVVAKTDAAHQALTDQFRGREVKKVYHAIVCGEFIREAGEIRAHIARHADHRKRMAVYENAGREAHTSYRVTEALRSASLVEIEIHTGRTHQIRVHFESIGHPVFGDPLYGRRQNRRVEEATGVHPPRVMLHAFKLAFTHPVTGQRASFTAPRPQDFAETLAALRV
jgi:23S rRNA pseudouridine1911/1915/1917 synthase